MSAMFVFWLATFAAAKLTESIAPARAYEIRPSWWRWWLTLNALGLALSLVANRYWQQAIDSYGRGGAQHLIGFYLLYSFVNYWLHRAKHIALWRLHELHHAPAHMRSELSLWRHPVETMFNLGVLLGLGYLLQIPVEIATKGLLIEGVLEIVHHGNFHTPRGLRWLGGIFQLPEMHLIHHQKGVHRYNYSPVALWDHLFGTARIPTEWRFEGLVGLQVWDQGDWRRLIWWCKSNC